MCTRPFSNLGSKSVMSADSGATNESGIPTGPISDDVLDQQDVQCLDYLIDSDPPPENKIHAKRIDSTSQVTNEQNQQVQSRQPKC